MNTTMKYNIKDEVKELVGTDARKYKAKYLYVNLEKYKELYNIILENISDIVEKEMFERYLKIEGMEIEGLTVKKKNILAIRFYLLKEYYFDIIPLDDKFEEVIYCDSGQITDKKEVISFKSAIQRIRIIAKTSNSIGYFDGYDENTENYLLALEKYEKSDIEMDLKSLYKIGYDQTNNLVDAEILLEKIDLSRIDDKKILSNIFYLKHEIYTKMSIFTGIKNNKLVNECWYKSIEYNPKNINALLSQNGMIIANIIETVEKNNSLVDYLKNEINKDIISVKNLEFEIFEKKIEEYINENNLDAMKDTLKDREKLELKLKIIELYETILYRIKENKYKNKEIIDLNNKILRVLKEGIEDNSQSEEKKVEDIDLNKYKILADALYLNCRYNDAITHYKKLIEYMNTEKDIYLNEFGYNKKISNDKLKDNMKKEIYEKLIDSYIKINDYEHARKEYEQAVEEFENEKVFKMLEKVLKK